MMLHDGFIINSNKQKSSQGSVFYVKKTGEEENGTEYVLKIVKCVISKVLV